MKKGELLSKAILFGTRCYYGKYDKAGKPYITHPLRVMDALDADGEDEETLCIGILHDAVEDGYIDGKKVTYQMLRNEGFTERIIHGVAGLTKTTGESPEEYEDKVMETVDRMKVKRADLKDNSRLDRLKGVTEKDIERMANYQRFYWKIEQKLREIESRKHKQTCCFKTVERESSNDVNATSYPNVIEQ